MVSLRLTSTEKPRDDIIIMAADGPDSAVKDLLEKSDELRRKADDLLVEFNNLSEKIKQLERAATKALQKSDKADQTTRPPDRTRSG